MPVEDCVCNAADAIRLALQTAGLAGRNVRGFAAGIAALTAPGDGTWAQRIALACDIRCEGQFVGDEVVAHLGAFAGAPGIVYIAGTGSIVFGTTEAGARVSNFDYGHYANQSAAWWLGCEAMMRIAAGEAGPEDAAWVGAFLAGLSPGGVTGLRGALRAGTVFGRVGAVAPAVTSGAERGTPLPRAVCDCAAEDLVRGIRLLVPEFADRPVRVAPAGSVACSDYMRSAVRRLASRTPDCQWMEPVYPPVVGAAILALRPFGFQPPNEVFDRLQGAVPRG
jgi:N-acetylglucosamine kinase-like BadF-type ATPase